MPSERGSLPHFAGRKRELEQLSQLLDSVLDGVTTGGIQLVTGVPGVGKSELGRQFARRLKERADITCLWTDVAVLPDAVNLFMDIAGAMGEAKKGTEIAGLDTSVSGGSVSVASIKAQVSFDRARRQRPLHSMLTTSLREAMWRDCRAVVLLIDELQSVAAEAMPNLTTLHKGDHECPIFVVGIGLQHTASTLSKADDGRGGISRVNAPLRLTPLAPEEALDAILGNMACFGHDIPEACAKALAMESHGFPQHIHGFLKGAMDVISKHGSIDVGATLQEAIEKGRAQRIDYCQSRLASMATVPSDEAMFPIVRALAAADADFMRHSAAVRAYEGSEFDGEAVIRDAIDHGVLTRQPKGTVGFGIPSFRAYLTNELKAFDQEP